MAFFKPSEVDKRLADARAALGAARAELLSAEEAAGITAAIEQLRGQSHRQPTDKQYRELVFAIPNLEARKKLVAANLDLDRAFDDSEDAEIKKSEWEAARARGRTWANQHYLGVAVLGAIAVYGADQQFGTIGALVALALLFPAQVALILDRVKSATSSAEILERGVEQHRADNFKRLLEPHLFDPLEAVTGVPSA